MGGTFFYGYKHDIGNAKQAYNEAEAANYQTADIEVGKQGIEALAAGSYIVEGKIVVFGGAQFAYTPHDALKFIFQIGNGHTFAALYQQEAAGIAFVYHLAAKVEWHNNNVIEIPGAHHALTGFFHNAHNGAGAAGNGYLFAYGFLRVVKQLHGVFITHHYHG